MNESLGQHITRLRKTKKLTQEELAKRLNISSQAISKWENDLSAPDISLLSPLADIFETTIDELLGRKQKEDSCNIKKINELNLILKASSAEGDVTLFKYNLNIFKMFLKIEEGIVGSLFEAKSINGDCIKITIE